jgi:hypothetical protein
VLELQKERVGAYGPVGIRNEFASQHKDTLDSGSSQKGARDVDVSRDGNYAHMCSLGGVWKEGMAV